MFRSEVQKARILKLVDQSSDEELLEQGKLLAEKEGIELSKNSIKKEYLKQLAFQKLQLCKKVSILEPFTLPSWEQMMDPEQTFLAFLMNNQNQTMATDNPILFDFKAPLELEIVFLKDAQM